ncbi:hypothetical protein, partial [Escherichia coli]|uniref:hypothetical protein n=1 Tax=Escherichia coli TaxID=562 RepID=UPI001BFDC721
ISLFYIHFVAKQEKIYTFVFYVSDVADLHTSDVAYDNPALDTSTRVLMKIQNITASINTDQYLYTSIDELYKMLYEYKV